MSTVTPADLQRTFQRLNTTFDSIVGSIEAKEKKRDSLDQKEGGLLDKAMEEVSKTLANVKANLEGSSEPVKSKDELVADITRAEGLLDTARKLVSARTLELSSQPQSVEGSAPSKLV